VRIGAFFYSVFTGFHCVHLCLLAYQKSAIVMISISMTVLILGAKVIKILTNNHLLQNIIESVNDEQFQPATWMEEAIIKQKQKRFSKVRLTLITLPMFTATMLIIHPVISEVNKNIIWNVLLGDVEHPIMFYGLWIYYSFEIFLQNIASPVTELLQPFCMSFAVIQFELIAFRLQQLSVRDEEFEAKLIKHIKHHHC
jgi:hypothetical protein